MRLLLIPVNLGMFYLIREPCGPALGVSQQRRVSVWPGAQCCTAGNLKGNDVGQMFGGLADCSCGRLRFHVQTSNVFLSPPAVHAGLLRLGHGHRPHADIWMEPCLWPSPVPLLPAPYLCSGPDPPSCCPAGPPGPSPALPVRSAQTDPPRLGEDPTHPLHSARRRLPQWAGGHQPRVREAVA